MILTHIILRSLKEEIVGMLSCSAFAFTLLLFFVGTVDAQAIGPQASRLIGTIQSRNFIGAVFSDSKGEQSFYRVFDTLPDGSKIVTVRSDSISLKGSDGTSYDMYIAHDMTRYPVENTAAPVRPDVSAEPVAPATVQKSDAEIPKARSRPHGRPGQRQSDAE
jgi:hypothetical protein